MSRLGSQLTGFLLLLVLLAATPLVHGQGTLAPAQRAEIDTAAQAVLTGTGAPSFSIAVVRKGKIVYEQAYGSARLIPLTPATSTMPYSIGSVSKQFIATAVLLLAEEKRLSLDDKVSRWFPGLTRAREVTVRQLLSMTAGYQDYWPQDYVFPAMRQPTTPLAVAEQWGRKPLDFEPGTKWQYSNTNYIIAGLIVEKVSGMGLLNFLRKHIFSPLGMTSVQDIDEGPLGPAAAAGYLRNAGGPLRLAPKEGKGWLFAAGQLAMTAHDLALWDISVINQTILQPASYRTMQTDVLLKSGVATGYGLGVRVAHAGERRLIAHSGAVSGFVSRNEIYPDDHAALVVLANSYAPGPLTQLAARIAQVLFEEGEAETTNVLAQARNIFTALQQGQLERAALSPNANDYFSEQVLADYKASLNPLGPPIGLVQVGQSLRGGMIIRAFRLSWETRTLQLTTCTLPDGKLEMYMIE